MFIKYIKLEKYRNYEKLFIELNKNINVFIGDNAQGKTNILESIYLCSIGKSYRTNRDKEMIMWNQNESSVEVYVEKDRIDKKINIKIPKEGKKKISVNSINLNKISEMIGILNVVMFSPEDLKIVKESPVHRRRFLDIEICKLNKRYYYNLVQYNKALEERNAAIKKWKFINNEILDTYDEQLAVYGSYIISERNKYINHLQKNGKKIHYDITSGIEKIEFKYMTCIDNIENITGALIQKLKMSRNKDFERKTTLTGPHRDDFNITINGIDARTYGSQGQQRTSVLTIKFATIEIIKEITGEYPVLLLDDVLSELDANRQKYILNNIDNIQTIITCTGISEIRDYLNKEASLFKVKSGNVKKI